MLSFFPSAGVSPEVSGDDEDDDEGGGCPVNQSIKQTGARFSKLPVITGPVKFSIPVVIFKRFENFTVKLSAEEPNGLH